MDINDLEKAATRIDALAKLIVGAMKQCLVQSGNFHHVDCWAPSLEIDSDGITLKYMIVTQTHTDTEEERGKRTHKMSWSDLQKLVEGE